MFKNVYYMSLNVLTLCSFMTVSAQPTFFKKQIKQCMTKSNSNVRWFQRGTKNCGVTSGANTWL